MPVIGFLNVALPDAFAGFTADFRAGLEEAGFVEGRDVKIEYRWAEGHYDNLPALAAELENSGVAVIVANGTTGLRSHRREWHTISENPST
jgi:putative ABC transport system substrate-binding protein